MSRQLTPRPFSTASQRRFGRRARLAVSNFVTPQRKMAPIKGGHVVALRVTTMGNRGSKNQLPRALVAASPKRQVPASRNQRDRPISDIGHPYRNREPRLGDYFSMLHDPSQSFDGGFDFRLSTRLMRAIDGPSPGISSSDALNERSASSHRCSR